MKKIIFLLMIFATTEIYSQANIQYTTNFKFRTIKRGYTGDWIGSQTDTTNNQGLNYNALRSENMFSKIFNSSYGYIQAFKDSVNAFVLSTGTYVTVLTTQTNITGQKRFSNVANDVFGDTASFTYLIGNGAGITALNGSNISTGTVDTARTLSKVTQGMWDLLKTAAQMDSNRVFTTDKVQTATGTKTFNDINFDGDIVIDEYVPATLKYFDGTYTKQISGGTYTGNRTFTWADTSGEILTTGYAGSIQIGAGDSIQVSIPGLTQTGQVQLTLNEPSSAIPLKFLRYTIWSAGTLSIYGDATLHVSYLICKK